MEVILLAAGHGTRLWDKIPKAKNKPKGLFEYNGKPVIEHALEPLLKIPEIKRITLVTNDKFFPQFVNWRQNYDREHGISYPNKLYILNDGTTTPENRLGAIGDLNYTIEHMRINDDVLVLASDYAFLFDFNKLLDYQRQVGKSVTLATVMTPEEIAGKHGNIQVDENGLVTRFVEKPEKAFSPLSSVACYIVSKNDFQYMRGCLAENKDATGYLFEKLLEKSQLYAFAVPRDKIVSIDQLIKNG